MKLRVLFAALFCFLSTGMFAATVTLDSSTSVDAVTNGQLPLVFTVKGALSADDAAITASGTAKITSVSVYMTEVDSGTPAKSDKNDATAKYYIEVNDPPTSVAQSNNINYDITWSVILTDGAAQNAGESLGELLAAGETTTIKIKYTLEGNTTAESETITLKVESRIVTTAIAGLTVKGSYESVKATWNKKDIVTFNTGSASAPSGAVVVAIDQTAFTGSTLPARKYISDSTTAAATCDYVSDAGDGGACVVCGDDTYLDEDELADMQTDGVYIGKVSGNSSAAATVSGLENNKDYMVFAYYQPHSTKVSECYSATPQNEICFACTNGEGDPKPTRLACFIATAAFGSPLERHVDAFRWFRDAYLEKNFLGRAFIDTYYALSPPVAQFIERHETLKVMARMILTPLADYLEASRDHSDKANP